LGLAVQILPPIGYIDQPANSFATKFVHMSWNKVRDLAENGSDSEPVFQPKGSPSQGQYKALPSQK
jgi:hypothetical protein